MKRLISLVLLFAAFSLSAQDFKLPTERGDIAARLTLPDGFNPDSDKCPMVIVMHGIFSGKDRAFIKALTEQLSKRGIAAISFDFNGHGKSYGRMQDMTVEKELADAKAIWEYAKTLPYVTELGIMGHSQGGVIASMTAGRLAEAAEAEPKGVVLLAPGAVIKYACQKGRFFNAQFDPKDPPEYIRCLFFYKLGREYLLTTQDLDVYGTAAKYEGPVLILHGSKDTIVPLWCSDNYMQVYGDNASLEIIDGENHTMSKKRGQVSSRAADYFKNLFAL